MREQWTGCSPTPYSTASPHRFRQDAATGASLWEGERYGHGQLMYADGKLIVLADNGTLVLLPATRERPEEISRVAALNGRTWAVPTLAGGRLLVRNEREMVSYDLRAH